MYSCSPNKFRPIWFSFWLVLPSQSIIQQSKLFNNYSYYLFASFLKVIKDIQTHDGHNTFLFPLSLSPFSHPLPSDVLVSLSTTLCDPQKSSSIPSFPFSSLFQCIGLSPITAELFHKEVGRGERLGWQLQDSLWQVRKDKKFENIPISITFVPRH